MQHVAIVQVSYLDQVRREIYEERAAIMEFDGGLSREDAERAHGVTVMPKDAYQTNKE